MGNGNIWRPWRDVDQSLQRFPDSIASSLEAGSAQSLSPPPPSLLLLLLVFSQRPALYLPTFRHLLSVNKLISLSSSWLKRRQWQHARIPEAAS